MANTEKESNSNSIVDLRLRFKCKSNKEVITYPQKQHRPRVLQEVHASDVDGVFSGYLKVFTTKRKQWKRCWFVLKDKVLYKYNASEDSAAIESCPLLGYRVEALPEPSHDGVDTTLMFRLCHPNSNIIEPMKFRTETASAAEQWIKQMKDGTKP